MLRLVEHFEPREGVSMPRAAMYQLYIEFCQQACMEPINQATFGKAVRSSFEGLKTRRLGMRGHSKYLSTDASSNLVFSAFSISILISHASDTTIMVCVWRTVHPTEIRSSLTSVWVAILHTDCERYPWGQCPPNDKHPLNLRAVTRLRLRIAPRRTRTRLTSTSLRVAALRPLPSTRSRSSRRGWSKASQRCPLLPLETNTNYRSGEKPKGKYYSVIGSLFS